jgi:hypothetical protein
MGFVNHGMDENILPEPRMKRVQNLPLNVSVHPAPFTRRA